MYALDVALNHRQSVLATHACGLISIGRGKHKLSGPQRKEENIEQSHGRQEHAPVQRLSNL